MLLSDLVKHVYFVSDDDRRKSGVRVREHFTAFVDIQRQTWPVAEYPRVEFTDFIDPEIVRIRQTTIIEILLRLPNIQLEVVVSCDAELLQLLFM